MNRRLFGRTAAAGFAFQVVPSRVFGANERIALAGIGTAGKGAVDVAESAKIGFQIVGLTDVADVRRNPEVAAGRAGALGATRDAHPDAKFYGDYREMLHDLGDKVDAVTVSTPDHHHFHAASAAMRAGKHVYCQKPLTHGLWEARTLAALAKETGVKTQMGNQGQASDGSRRCAELIQSGVIGAVKEVHIWTDRPTWAQGFAEPPTPQPVPPWLDWEQWIGPAPFVEYSSKIAPFHWRGWWDYGTGALGDIACHYLAMIDTALQPGPPLTVQAAAEGGTERSAPIVSTVTYEFAKGLKYIWYDGQRGAQFNPETWTLGRGESNHPGKDILNGLDPKKYDVAVVGDRATFYFAYARPADWVVFPTGRIDGFAWPAPTLPRAREQSAYAEWQDAIQGKIAQSESHFAHAGPFTETVLLGVLAQRFPGQKLEWDHEVLAVKGRPELAPWIRREYRKGWEV